MFYSFLALNQYQASSSCITGKYRAEKAEISAQTELTSLEGADFHLHPKQEDELFPHGAISPGGWSLLHPLQVFYRCKLALSTCHIDILVELWTSHLPPRYDCMIANKPSDVHGTSTVVRIEMALLLLGQARQQGEKRVLCLAADVSLSPYLVTNSAP